MLRHTKVLRDAHAEIAQLVFPDAVIHNYTCFVMRNGLHRKLLLVEPGGFRTSTKTTARTAEILQRISDATGAPQHKLEAVVHQYMQQSARPTSVGLLRFLTTDPHKYLTYREPDIFDDAVVGGYYYNNRELILPTRTWGKFYVMGTIFGPDELIEAYAPAAERPRLMALADEIYRKRDRVLYQ